MPDAGWHWGAATAGVLVRHSPARPPTGPSPIDEIVVVDRRGRVFTGVYAIRKVCLRIPLLPLYGLLLYVPSIRRLVGGSEPGCNGYASEV